MHSLRSTGIFLIVCAALCGLVAFERYQTARRTAMAISNLIAGFEIESVSIPIETKVAGFLSVMFVVAGLRCIWTALRPPREML